jgi:threonine aldolase
MSDITPWDRSWAPHPNTAVDAEFAHRYACPDVVRHAHPFRIEPPGGIVDVIDLRTDTITQPTQAMRDAIAAAPVGDDFYFEDPTVKALETRAAEMLGKEKALYFPSGTMANLVAHLTHAPSGGEVIGPEDAHNFRAETGGLSRLAGMLVRGVQHAPGHLDADAYAARIRGPSLLAQGTVLLWAEQPIDGFVVPLAELRALRALADAHRLPMHFDGARIFNAAVALNTTADLVAATADSVTFCVSKGLGAPVGSLLAGAADFVDRARFHRQMLGGGMRQAGIVAAGGLYALSYHVQRLREDHQNAARLAAGLRKLAGLEIDREIVQTNMFYVALTRRDMAASQFIARLAETGVLVSPVGPQQRWIRFVTHLGITSDDIDCAITAVRHVMSG